jgi:hypothetical protein
VSNYRLDLKTNPSKGNPPAVPAAARGESRIDAARKVKGYLKLLLSVPVVVTLLYLGSVLYNHERVVPRGVETVQDFYVRYGNPPRVDGLFVGGRKFYRVIGEIPAPLGFPKGNPVYIFDSTGRLIDWTGESLNDPDFASRWAGVESQSMSVAYFLERFPPN